VVQGLGAIIIIDTDRHSLTAPAPAPVSLIDTYSSAMWTTSTSTFNHQPVINGTASAPQRHRISTAHLLARASSPASDINEPRI
jgi:hypothetical protein